MHKTSSRARGAAGAVALVLAGSIAGAACGASQPPVRHTQPSQCQAQIHQLGGQASAVAGPSTPGVHLAAAAVLSVKVEVTPGSSGPACAVATSGKTVDLAVGHSIVFVANGLPGVRGSSSSLRISTSPGPSTSFLGQPPTSHVIVTVTAVRPGTATLTWIDCSGTAC